jgi:hypothetical protein
VFEAVGSLTVESPDGGGSGFNGDAFLVEVFKSLGATHDWPAPGSREWTRLRRLALQQVVARLGRDEGLLDAISVSPVPNADGDGTQTAEDEQPDPRVGVQAYGAMIRRGKRNPEGWFRTVNRKTPYRVIAVWAEETCPGVQAESLFELLDSLREVRWWDDDGHIRGGDMLRALEEELEEGSGDEQWMLVVSDFHDAIERLRSVFERLCLL